MRSLDRPIIQVTIRFENLALDEVRCTHRVPVILSGISSSNAKCCLKRRPIFGYSIELQSLETCSGRYCTLNTIFCIVRFVDYGCPAFCAVCRIWVDSLGVATVGRIIDLRSRFRVTRIRRCSICKNVLVGGSGHLRKCLLLSVSTASCLKIR